MSKEELSKEYQKLLKEYQETETERRENINEIKRLKEQKDIEEQKIEFEELKEKFEPDAKISTEELVQRAKSRQEKLNKIEEKRLEVEEKNKELLAKKEEIRNSAEECYNKSIENEEKLNNLLASKKEIEIEIESKRAKIEEWSHKENRTTEEYMKLGNELKESIEDLTKTEESIKAEKERLEKYGKMEIRGAEILYKSFINGANRIDEGKTIVLNKIQEKENDEEKDKKHGTAGIQAKTPPRVIVGNKKGSIEFTPEELESFKANVASGPRQEQKDETGNGLRYIEDKEKNSSVRILYSAKTDKYIVTNINTKEQKLVSRKELEKLDKNILAEEIGKDLRNVDTNIYQLLKSYDEEYKTHKADEYIETLSTIGMNKVQRQNAMEKSQIDIEYNLKGLFNKFYDKTEQGLYEYKDKFSKEEREELLDIANNAKIKGIATVKKGPKVTIMELLNKAVKKVFSNKLLNGKKVEQIPEKTGKQEETENQAEKVEQNKLKVEELSISEGLKKYAKGEPSLEQKKQDAARREILQTFKERQNSKKEYTWENGNIVPKVNINHEQALNNLKNNKKDNEESIEEVK